MGNLHRAALHTKPEEFAVLAGKGEVLFPSLVSGAAGCIAALVNMYADFAQICFDYPLTTLPAHQKPT